MCYGISSRIYTYLAIEEGVSAASQIATYLDAFALAKMAGDAETNKEKLKLAVEAAMGVFKGKLGNKVSNKLIEALDKSDFSKIISQVIPALQQCIDNIFAD